MRLAIVPPGEAARKSWVGAAESFEPGSTAHLADELRAMALALGPALRTSVVRRTASLLSAASPVDEARLIEVCRALERRGDLLGGPGGTLAPAPLRLIESHGDRFLVVGSLPTSQLRALVPGGEVSSGVGRTIRVGAGGRAELLQKVESAGGRVLSAEEWAGLSRAPQAGPEWLAELTQRAANEGESHGVDLTTRWDDVHVYAPPPADNPTRRWHRTSGPLPLPLPLPSPSPSPSIEVSASRSQPLSYLLRARQSGGWSAYGWGVPRGPNELPRPFVPLTRDEARRTEYAVDRASGKPRTLSVAMDNGLWWLTLDMALPGAEYRFVLALSEERREDAWPAKLGFSGEAWGRAAAVLEERLGVRISPDQPSGA